MTKLLPVLAVALAALALGAMADAAGQRTTSVRLSASLTADAQVPVSKNVPAAAIATFTATLVGNSLKWTLSFSHLGSEAIAAQIRLGAPGKSGATLIPLCGPCRSPSSLTANPTTSEITALKAGKAYVDIFTAKNPNGEIRGQITLVQS